QKGAFTGAIAQRKGRFELADGGTLFLDEIGELPPAAQAKLLRALQEQEFERVGCSESIKVNVRVIAATNRDLAAMVRAGEFRSDLFYRLCVFPIRIPPLRERREDIPLLARQFLREQARKLNKPLVDIAPRALADLQRHDWPGNIRELQNVIERAAIMSSDPLLEFGDAFDPPFATSANLHKRGTLREIEHSGIVQALLASDWIIEGPKGAAAILGLHPSTLRSRMKKLSITRAER
ncbi:MAG: sigma 54-interacting transcriptional regulator, partial [Gammaproteobacteria bacterium]